MWLTVLYRWMLQEKLKFMVSRCHDNVLATLNSFPSSSYRIQLYYFIESGKTTTNILLSLSIQTMEIVPGDVKYYTKETNKRHDQPLLCSHEFGRHSLRLPPSSPYDKFLKAAGCQKNLAVIYMLKGQFVFPLSYFNIPLSIHSFFILNRGRSSQFQFGNTNDAFEQQATSESECI